MKFIPYNTELKLRARELRKRLTKAERKIWADFLSSLNIPIKRQKVLDNYIVDFYCSKAKLVIEVDGDSHSTKDGIEYDEHRTAVLESFGLEVIRFTNDEVLFEFNKVQDTIIEKIASKAGIGIEELI
ncbi:MAG: hypothetical protein CVV25_09695 [Ignavibacteriae bacterium HGW-Ignavibacteriae-4]|jgi:very-short-patch-repair endonuclease|nr:MAG: hypothetical protein CVV25_09695 [Ignavibacteriae bacterium HGW-Ignavibacteriae-4]